jgi:hypothetical protein
VRGARPSTFATGQMYRQGNRWLLAVSYSMGTPACCMMLFGVRLMGSNVLKYTRDPPCGLLSILGVFWTLAAPSTKGAVEKELWQCIPHQSISSQIKVTNNIEFSNRIRIVGERRQQDNNLLHKHTISHMMSYMIS